MPLYCNDNSHYEGKPRNRKAEYLVPVYKCHFDTPFCLKREHQILLPWKGV